MKPLRFRKLFEHDGKESSLTQYDLKKYARLAVVEDVDPEKGLCNIRWLDRPGIRKDVIITQNSSTNYSFPKKGSVVICIFDRYDRAFITSYIPLGQISRVQNLKTLPKFKEGETFFEAGDSYIHIRKNGDIILATSQGYMSLNNSNNTLSQEFANWKLDTEGTSHFSGLVKRFVTNLGNKRVETIEKSDGEVFIEHKLKVYETNKNNELLYNLTIGTFIDNNGNVLSKSGNIVDVSSNKQLCVNLELNNGVRLTIDKDGYVQIDGAKMFINNPGVDESEVDSDRGLSNKSNLGTKGQHVAREHDKVTIPFGSIYSDEEHLGLNSKAASNLTKLTELLANYGVSGVPITPINVATVNTDFEGEITEGAENIQFGDD